jgi:transposase InsO family protein
VIESLTGQGFSEREACRVVGVNRSSYTYWRKRPPNQRELRRAWLEPLVAKIHADSFGTYGYLRVAAELRLGHGVIANHKLVHSIMRERGLKGLPKPPAGRRGPIGAFVAADLVCRDFSEDGPNKLWVTDITEHPTREGKVFCCAVLDAFSRKVVGWSIDSTQTAALVTNALGMAIKGREPDRTVIHSDRGSQFTSWAFTQRVKEAELMPSVGRTGTALDNAMMESFWGRMQVELLNRRRWKTRVELANAIFEYIESFHNNRRRHSSLNMLTPTEFEELHQKESS